MQPAVSASRQWAVDENLAKKSHVKQDLLLATFVGINV
jgi:hypothetical protein